MTLEEAILARHSVRQYQERPVDAEIVARLNDEMAICNQEGDLHIQLVTGEPYAFGGGMAKYGKFSGVSNYLAMVGRKGADEAIGYYGERLVLLSQTLGLNSCWVGLTFKKQPDRYEIASGEKLYCVIAFGYGANEGVQHPMRPMEQFVKATGTKASCEQLDSMPEWFKRGMDAALLAPTAVNQQKFEFELIDKHTVAANSRFTLVGYGKIDLGIVKYHFEVGAGKENFSWKN